MDQNLNKEINFSTKMTRYYKENKLKFIISFVLIIIIISILFILDKNNQKKNILISEKFVKANLLLSSDKNGLAKKNLEEIIFSKNKFYSLLALNTIIEKNLSKDKNQILRYFDILENSKLSENNYDLLKLKKALYLIKISEVNSGESLLRDLIDKNSIIKTLAQDLLKNN